MPRALLLTTAALACFVVALGCQRERRVPSPPHRSDGQTTIILGSPPAPRATDTASGVVPEAPASEPAMSAPPVEDIIDAPASTPASMPAPSAPGRGPSQYRDGCGRPLVA